MEDAEEIAALNLAKFRKAQGEAEEAEKRANLAEQAMGKLRARSVMRSETPVIFLKILQHFETINFFLFFSVLNMKTGWFYSINYKDVKWRRKISSTLINFDLIFLRQLNNNLLLLPRTKCNICDP